MDVKLSSRSEGLIREYLAEGGYRTAEEVIDDALESLAEKRPLTEGRTSILELQGLGKAIWQGIDAQEYVDGERASWNG
jgi:hypothetical protein